MKGILFQAVERVAVGQLPDPELQMPTDAIVQVSVAGLCGSDLHPFHGREIGIEPGTIMGHEFVGQVVAIGDAVLRHKVGDRVAAAFSVSCGQCFYCLNQLSSRCEQSRLFGWIQDGEGLHGGQAQLVRVPLADGTLMGLPPHVSDDAGLLLGDNLSTGFYSAELAELQPDQVCVVIGCGCVGLCSIIAARLRGVAQVFAADLVAHRLQLAEQLGAVAMPPNDQLVRAVRAASGGRGADAVMELVGLPAAQQLAFALLRPGGKLAVIGCHSSPHFSFSPAEAYNKNLTLRTGRCPARSLMDRLMPEVQAGRLELDGLITHRFGLDDGPRAYEVFANRQAGCVKAVFDLHA